MSAPCDLVEDFFDGEMAPSQAEDFRVHAATCARCQRELVTLSKLHALERQYRPEPQLLAVAELGPSPRRLRSRWAWAAAGAAAAMAAMLVLWIGRSKLADQVREEIFYPGGSVRLTDGRSAYARAGAHRPRSQRLLGPGDRLGGPPAGSFDALGKLERADDRPGMAALFLAGGTPAGAEQAMRVLNALQESPDVLSELALAHLVRGNAAAGDAQEALRFADQALALDPRHGPALFNRALALQALGLDGVAATAFGAAAALGEPGWSDEAAERANERRKVVEDARDSWLKALEAGNQLVLNGVRPPTKLLGKAVIRSFFYNAVRSRSTGEEVKDLLPLARDLDHLARNKALESYVLDVAARDFKVRGPLAAEFRSLMAGQPVDIAALLQRLRKANQPDLLLGALATLPPDQLDAKELEALARDLGKDAWLATAALLLESKALTEGQASPEAWAKARGVLDEAARVCAEAKLDYRCADVEFELAYAYDHASQPEQADAHARRGWAAAGRADAWEVQGQLVLEMAQEARHREDASMANALYREGLERDAISSPQQQRFVHEGLANLEYQLLHFDEARRHLNAAIATRLPLGLPGALALADIARIKPDPVRDPEAMGNFRKGLDKLGPGERALAEMALGQWELTRDRTLGEQLLRKAIDAAGAPGLEDDQSARRARAFAYTALILDAGKRGDASGALRLFEEEAERTTGASGLPAHCLLAVVADGERVLAVVRDAAGGPPVAVYNGDRRQPLPSNLSRLVPRDVLDRLSGCAQVAVLARAPVYGRPGLIPPDMAWSYRGVGPSQESLSAGEPGRHLVVHGVTLSPARASLGPPVRWNVPHVQGEHLDQLTGQDATPSEVLRQMEDASDITVIAHALPRPESDEAYLVLSPEADGDDALRASQVQRARLHGHPLVVLVSCEGARPARVLHEARSLPAAFLRAGARAVLAASSEVPEQDAPTFFEEVRARIHAGVPPAEALRATRAAWVSQGRGAPWIDGVLLFE